MLLDRVFSSVFAQDLAATVITFGAAVGWLRLMDGLAHRRLVDPRLSRKVIHIATGPLFVLCWPLYSQAPHSRWLAALVPLAITVLFLGVGSGLLRDPAAVQAMTRSGNPKEILRGPLVYGLVFVVCTLLFWRDSPVGLVALMLLCGGDGLADIVGRRFGRHKLPFNYDKSWAGSLAMFLGGLGLALVFTGLFHALGFFRLSYPAASLAIVVIAFLAAAVEALPLRANDNLTVSLAAIILGQFLL